MTIHERYPFVWKESRKKVRITETEQAEINLMNAEITVLDLNTRSYNALKRGAVNTIGDLIGRWETLGRLHGVGENCINEIKNLLLAYLIAHDRTDLVDEINSKKTDTKGYVCNRDRKAVGWN